MDDAVRDAHRRAADAGLDTYIDPATGYAVFTADHLLARGTCCGSGCRHCPYGADGSPTADRSDRA